MIVDACLYAGEAEMLELRMRTLADVVDEFVVVTCDHTHQGERRSRTCRVPDLVHDPRFVGRFTVYCMSPVMSRADKGGQIYHRHETDRGPAGGSFFFQHIEKQHRDAVVDAVRTLPILDADMIVMVSDVDEIPDPDTVTMLDHILRDGAAPWACCEQRFHSTALDLLHPYQPWLGTMAARLRDLEPQRMRTGRADERDRITFVQDAGVHFSWFGTDAERQRKLDTFSHAELRGRFDPAVGRQERTHSNGEPLTLIELADLDRYDWPEPITDGTFAIPPEWWA